MHALNYLRKATIDLNEFWIPGLRENGFSKDADVCSKVLAAAQKSQKFILPNGGRIFNDRLRGLPDIVRLPYPNILIEYPCEGLTGNSSLIKAFRIENTIQCPKRIVVAQEVDDLIEISSFVFTNLEHKQHWNMLPYLCRIHKQESELKSPDLTLPGIYPLPKASFNGAPFVEGLRISFGQAGAAWALLGDEWQRHAYCDLHDEIMAVLELIEALSCKNIDYEPLVPRKLNKNSAKKGAMPFDEYHILVLKDSARKGDANTIMRSHRSPREHLRRGHIRKLNNGEKIWVNSTVVNPGSGGKVTSFYDATQLASARA